LDRAKADYEIEVSKIDVADDSESSLDEVVPASSSVADTVKRRERRQAGGKRRRGVPESSSDDEDDDDDDDDDYEETKVAYRRRVRRPSASVASDDDASKDADVADTLKKIMDAAEHLVKTNGGKFKWGDLEVSDVKTFPKCHLCNETRRSASGAHRGLPHKENFDALTSYVEDWATLSVHDQIAIGKTLMLETHMDEYETQVRAAHSASDATCLLCGSSGSRVAATDGRHANFGRATCRVFQVVGIIYYYGRFNVVAKIGTSDAVAAAATKKKLFRQFAEAEAKGVADAIASLSDDDDDDDDDPPMSSSSSRYQVGSKHPRPAQSEWSSSDDDDMSPPLRNAVHSGMSSLLSGHFVPAALLATPQAAAPALTDRQIALRTLEANVEILAVLKRMERAQLSMFRD
jgi:hypothetical protein